MTDHDKTPELCEMCGELHSIDVHNLECAQCLKLFPHQDVAEYTLPHAPATAAITTCPDCRGDNENGDQK